jgi:hypothetical protein
MYVEYCNVNMCSNHALCRAMISIYILCMFMCIIDDESIVYMLQY